MACAKFDSTRPCLVLAPHLEYPLRNGADILIDRKWSYFSEHVPFVDIVGKDTVSRYQEGKLLWRERYASQPVSKWRAAVRTLIRQSHYLLEKNVTKEFKETARLYLLDPDYDTVVFSFIWTAAILAKPPEREGRLYCVETHNDEFKWFRDLRRTVYNPLGKATAYVSEQWIYSFLRKHQYDYLFLHVSKADQQGYLGNFPKHKSLVAPIGVEMPPDTEEQEQTSEPRSRTTLMFVGSLNVSMNYDALKFFASEFYPVLRAGLGRELEVLIVGSNPSKKASRLCNDMGWRVAPNVSDRKLEQLYREATFSILPFSYATGAKLKLLDSMAHGVPYLATSAVSAQADATIYPSLISDSPEEWLLRARVVREKGTKTVDKTAHVELARRSSWRAVATDMFETLVTRGQA